MIETTELILIIIAGIWGLIMTIVGWNLTQGRKDQQQLNNKHSTDIAVLKEIKMDEAKTRQIVADSLEPLKHGQEELKEDVKQMIIAISNLSVQIAKAGLMRKEDAE